MNRFRMARTSWEEGRTVVRGIEGKSAFKEARFPVIGTIKRTKARFAHNGTDYALRALAVKEAVFLRLRWHILAFGRGAPL